MIELLFATGYLALNLTLNDVAHTRQTRNVYYPISDQVDVTRYDCRLGVHNELGYLTGQEAYLRIDGELYGPYLIVDMQADVHANDPILNMQNRRLVADIDCPELVHRKAELVLILW